MILRVFAACISINFISELISSTHIRNNVHPLHPAESGEFRLFRAGDGSVHGSLFLERLENGNGGAGCRSDWELIKTYKVNDGVMMKKVCDLIRALDGVVCLDSP